MSFDEGNNMFMPVAPAYGGGYGNGMGGDWAWIIILLLAFGGGFGGMGNGNNLYPWLNNNDQINGGFRDQMINSTLNGTQTSVTGGFGDVQTALCGGFAGVNATVNGAQNSVSQQLYTNQIADMERSFAAQTANTQALSGLQGQLAQCCCDNRLATVQTQNVVQNEGAATRSAIQEKTQAILDKMCQQEIDSLKAANAGLQNQVLMRDLAASQAAQTAALVADNTAQTQYIVNRVAPYPIPSYTVPNPYGTTGTT